MKTWGETVELPAVTKEEAQKAYLAATDVATAMKPAVQEAVQARDDMLKDRFNYVSKHVNQTQYIVAGGKKVAPAGISGASFAIAGFCVLLGAIGTVVYVKTQVRVCVCVAHTQARTVAISTHSRTLCLQWGVNSALELGDRLRAKGAERKEVLERSNSAKLVRSVSSKAESTVKENIDLVRRPSQQMGAHFNESFKGVVKEGRGVPVQEIGKPATAP